MAYTNAQFPNVVAQKVQGVLSGRDQGLLDEGTIFVATNPTPGTGIALVTSITAETQTSPTMLIMNQWSPTDPGAKNIIPLGLRMICTAAPTTATYWQGSIRMDISNPLKYTSGGSLITPLPCGAAANASKALIYFGALVGLAQTNGGRLLANFMISPTIPVVKDVHNIEWGFGSATPVINATSVNAVRTVAVPPMAIPPGGWLAINTWGASSGAAPSFEFQFDYVER